MRPLILINVVGLTMEMLPQTQHLGELSEDGFARPMSTVLPAVTCSAQSSLLTGVLPRDHGIVGNGWYFRELAEIGFWKQSNHLVSGETIYQAARKRNPAYTTAKMFWWYNMYADVDWSVTPRPSYPVDGRKVFDAYSSPAELKDELQSDLGVFPLLRFWGPGADIHSSQWITSASLRVVERFQPSLMLVYLPHLDYNLQRLGPNDARIIDDIRAVDEQAGRLINAARQAGYEVAVVSEYAITEVDEPVHINRVLREHGFLTVRRELLGWETLDPGASRAFAVADHQVAHVYVGNPDDIKPVQTLLAQTSGIERVLDREQQQEYGIDHRRSGELVVVSAPRAWFTYYFWQDDALAPDYARTVDIHRKPGYDPCELFVDPQIKAPKLRIARRLLRKQLGFRYTMDVISLDAAIVRGSHGRLPTPGQEQRQGPVFICSSREIECDTVDMLQVKDMLLRLQFSGGAT